MGSGIAQALRPKSEYEAALLRAASGERLGSAHGRVGLLHLVEAEERGGAGRRMNIFDPHAVSGSLGSRVHASSGGRTSRLEGLSMAREAAWKRAPQVEVTASPEFVSHRFFCAAAPLSPSALSRLRAQKTHSNLATQDGSGVTEKPVGGRGRPRRVRLRHRADSRPAGHGGRSPVAGTWHYVPEPKRGRRVPTARRVIVSIRCRTSPLCTPRGAVGRLARPGERGLRLQVRPPPSPAREGSSAYCTMGKSASAPSAEWLIMPRMPNMAARPLLRSALSLKALTSGSS